MIRYLLDTDTIVSLFRGKGSVAGRIEAVGDERIATTAINLAELYYGAYGSSRVRENLRVVDALRARIQLFDFDGRAAVVFGEIKARLGRAGQAPDDSDLFIAAVALSTGSILVTTNTRHFSRIEGLPLESWV